MDGALKEMVNYENIFFLKSNKRAHLQCIFARARACVCVCVTHTPTPRTHKHIKVCFFYLKYIVLYEQLKNPTPQL